MKPPFVELFRTPNGNYFLDVNKNELIPISEPSFNYLRAILAGTGSDTPMPQELEELQAQGYLASQSVVQEIRHPYSRFLKTYLERKLGKITLQLTQNCNFRCKYCVYSEEINKRQRSHSTARMSWDVAKQAIDFLWKHSVDSKKINIGFYGGEPLLEFPLLKRVVEYSKERFFGKDLSFNITTNGTLLTDEMIYYFRDHNVSMMISLDGPKEINDRNRVFADGRGTYDAVMERIARIKEIAPDYASKLQISMVMDPENDFDCINAIYLEGNELERLSIMSTIVDRDYDDEDVAFSEEYLWKYEYHRFLAILAYFGRFPEEKVSPIAQQWIIATLKDHLKIEGSPSLRNIDAPSGPCVPGQLRLFVDVNGRFFPCERVSESSPAMCIGTLDGGFDLEQVERILNVGCLTETACKKCWCFRYCTLCAKKADNGYELSAETKLAACQEAKAAAYSMFRNYLLFKEIPACYPAQIRRGQVGGKTA